MHRLWLFWLPILYLLLLAGAAFDMGLHLSGSGEANAGAWIYIFSFWPSYLIGQALGLRIALPAENDFMLIVFQAVGFAAAGAIIDFLRWRRLRRT